MLEILLLAFRAIRDPTYSVGGGKWEGPRAVASLVVVRAYSSYCCHQVHPQIISFLSFLADRTQILVVASGVFNNRDPSDLAAELQSRLPIRVQLKPLTEDDYRAILPHILDEQVRTYGRRMI